MACLEGMTDEGPSSCSQNPRTRGSQRVSKDANVFLVGPDMDSYREDIKLVAATRPEEHLLPDKQTSFRDPVMLTIGSGADQLHLRGLRAHEPCVGWGNGASSWALCDLQRILARIDESNRRAFVHVALVRSDQTAAPQM